MAEEPEVVAGIFGVGLLGSAIADRLTAVGVRWIGYDPARPDLSPSPKAVLAESNLLILCLPTSHQTAELLPTIDHRRTIIDTTTGDPAHVARFGYSHSNYLDVTIGGSSAQLRAGEAILMAGAGAEVFEANRAFLQKLSTQVFHCGPPGSGAKMKLVFNLVLGLNRAALAEGLAFAEATGLDASAALEILQAGPAASKIMERKGSKMVSREYAPEARLAQHHKDVGLILQEATKAKLDLPLTQAHDRVLAMASALGYAESDNSALIEVYRSDSVNGR